LHPSNERAVITQWHGVCLSIERLNVRSTATESTTEALHGQECELQLPARSEYLALLIVFNQNHDEKTKTEAA